jgi:hypothetical protein
MSKPQETPGFAAFVPGFEFLQKLAQGQPASMAQWVAPTLDPKALEQRIAELKAVQFWLEQNTAALKATLQALEVQKMTLATLQTMNTFGQAGKAAPAAAGKDAMAATAQAMPQAMQYWGALTQQFQKIAGDAMNDLTSRAMTNMQGAAKAAQTAQAGAAAAKPAAAKTTRARKAKPD